MFPAMLRSPIPWLTCLSLEMKLQNAFGLSVIAVVRIYIGQSSRTKVFVHVFPDVTKLLPVFWISRYFCFLICIFFKSLLNQGRLYLEVVRRTGT